MYNDKLIPYYKLFSHISLCPRAINLHYTAATSCFTFYRQLLSNIMLTDFTILSYLINHSAPVNILSWQMVKQRESATQRFLLIWSFKINSSLERNLDLSSSIILTNWSLIYYLMRKLMSQEIWVSRHFPALELPGNKLCFSFSWISYKRV